VHSLSRFLLCNTDLTKLYDVISDASSRNIEYHASHLTVCGIVAMVRLVPTCVNSNPALSPALYAIRALFHIRITACTRVVRQQLITSLTVAVKLATPVPWRQRTMCVVEFLGWSSEFSALKRWRVVAVCHRLLYEYSRWYYLNVYAVGIPVLRNSRLCWRISFWDRQARSQQRRVDWDCRLLKRVSIIDLRLARIV